MAAQRLGFAAQALAMASSSGLGFANQALAMASSTNLLQRLFRSQPFSHFISAPSTALRPCPPRVPCSADPAPFVPFLCGRGDKKTKRGKRFKGSFGNCRPNREHRIRRIKERWEQPPGTPWPVPGLSVEEYLPVF